MIFNLKTVLALPWESNSGELIVAYTVGASLTRPQVFIATVAYLFGASSMVVPIVAMGNTVDAYFDTAANY